MSEEKTKVAVIGLGYVGLPTAALIADAGYEVLGVDIDPETLATLGEGKSTVAEDDVARLVERVLSNGALKVSETPAPADIFIICVPTPIGEDKTPDLRAVEAATRTLIPHLREGNLLILESTSPIGTTERVLGGAAVSAGLNVPDDIDICYCPERVFPGDTINEIVNNDRVVGGVTPRAAERAVKFYMSFCTGAATPVTAREAEFSKLVENTYRDVNIAIANAFARIAEVAGTDVTKVIEIANRHPRVNVHTPGPGVGGHCIPVDPWFLIDAYPEQAAILKGARLLNDDQPRYILEQAIRGGLPDGGKVAILGAAYRADIDDARCSPSVDLAVELGHGSYTWMTYDPYLKPGDAAHGLSDLGLVDRLEEALDDADAAILMTGHSDFRHLDESAFGPMNGKLILDARNVLNPRFFEGGAFQLYRLGDGTRPIVPTAAG